MTREERLRRRNELIRKDYLKWSDKKYQGVRIYTNDYIFHKLSEKYALAPKTIEHIVFYRYKY